MSRCFLDTHIVGWLLSDSPKLNGTEPRDGVRCAGVCGTPYEFSIHYCLLPIA